MTPLHQKEIFTLADVAAFFGETVATARKKIAARARAGFPAPRAKVFPNEPYKWDAAEVRAWDYRNRGQVCAPANENAPLSSSPGGSTPAGSPVPAGATGAGGGGCVVDRSIARARLLGRL